ncbi:MAG: D-cysteine desulfhydrase family protein [candidate division Zixibacteria bacterium]|nr:D-cysteine desulfhydrase family protein [candidate division Zixibacteria bacterium]
MKAKLKPPPRFQLAMTPTPLEAFALSPDPRSGIEIFIKRDDQTGAELSGNKIRKLEFILYDAVARKTDTIITCGGTQSNHCRAAAAMAARIGLDCELIVKGRKPAVPDGNLLLDTLFGAKIKYITDTEYEANIANLMAKRAVALKKKGKRPYIIPEGASNSLGLWGYFLAGIELKKQLDKAGITVDYIACAVGSGGTYAGLYLASLYLNWPVKVQGFAVCRNTQFFVNRISGFFKRFLTDFDLKLKPVTTNIHIDDQYIGPGYAKIGEKEAKFIKGVAANAGIILDPAYTGKAMLGLFDHIVKGKIQSKSNVVFIHTGGLVSLFPYRKKLSG